MNVTPAILTSILLTAAPGFASNGMSNGETSMLVILFIGFGAFIIVGQLVPGVMLFCSMLKGLFPIVAQNARPRAGAKAM